MGTIKIGSTKDKIGMTVDPRTVLFNDNNVKYIKCGLTEIWNYKKPLVPIMTSNTAPYGEVIRDSDHSSGSYKSYYAFDGKDDTRWHASKTTNAWIGYKFETLTKINKIMIQPYCETTDGRVKNFIVQGSNDNLTYIDLYNGIAENSGETQYFEFENEKHYLYYRVLIIDGYMSSGSIGVTELQFYGTQLRALIPAMTGDTTPSGEVSASSYYNDDYVAWHAFDNDNSTAWVSAETQTDTFWVQYKFNSPKKAIALKLASNTVNNANIFAKSFDLLGSNDGDDFEVVYSGENTQKGHGVTYGHVFDNNKEYKYYRLVVNNTFDESVKRKQIGELQLYA